MKYFLKIIIFSRRRHTCHSLVVRSSTPPPPSPFAPFGCAAKRSLFVGARRHVLENRRHVVLAGGSHPVTLDAPQALAVPLQGRVHDERRANGGDHPVHGPPAQARARHHLAAGPHHRVQLDRSPGAGRADRADFLPRPRVPWVCGGGGNRKKNMRPQPRLASARRDRFWSFGKRSPRAHGRRGLVKTLTTTEPSRDAW